MKFRPARLLLVGIAISSAFGSTLDVVTNFNAPNNGAASTAFSYGSGGTPAAFVVMPNGVLNCQGTPTYCYNNGLSFPSASGVTWNGTAGDIMYSGTIVQPNSLVQLGPQNIGTILRFTAPFSATFTVSGLFQGIDTGQHAVSTFVFANGVQQGSTGSVSTYGGQSTFSFMSALISGQKIDFIVVSASDCCNLSTGLKATITGTPSASTPEPGTLGLMFLGAPVLVLIRRYRS